MEEDLSLKEYIDSFKISLESNEEFIREIDWSDPSLTLAKKIKLYELQKPFILTFATQAEEILKRARGNVRGISEDTLKRLHGAIDLFKKRVHKYVIDNKDWVKRFKIEDGNLSVDEGNFIATLNTDLEKYKKIIKKIEVKEYKINVEFKKGNCVSLSMKKAIENRYEEIKDYVENLLNTTPPIVKKKKKDV